MKRNTSGRIIAAIAIAGLLASCGPREPGTASEVEAEALNKAAADLDAQAAPSTDAAPR